MARFKRDIPQLNSTSSADVAFILLLFFLLTGSLDSKSGIYRRLAPAAPEAAIIKNAPVEERNLLSLSIRDDNTVYLNGEPLPLMQIREIAKIFIDNPEGKDFLPQKNFYDIPDLGNVLASRDAVIHLEFSRKSNYQTYVSVLSELTAAYNELRNEWALEQFRKPFVDLSEEQQTAVREVYPLQISEKEIAEEEVSYE